jgi:hypothetical protein
MRITVSINMLFGIAACYSRKSAPAIESGVPLSLLRLSAMISQCFFK